MTFEPKNWVSNESITASDLNRIELGIAGLFEQVATLVENQKVTDEDVRAAGEDIADIMDTLEGVTNFITELGA